MRNGRIGGGKKTECYPDSQSKKPGASLIKEVGSGLLVVVIHFNFAYGCCRRVLSDSFLLLPFFSVGVVGFSAAVVTLDLAVATMPAAIGHKERAAGDDLNPKSQTRDSN